MAKLILLFVRFVLILFKFHQGSRAQKGTKRSRGEEGGGGENFKASMKGTDVSLTRMMVKIIQVLALVMKMMMKLVMIVVMAMVFLAVSSYMSGQRVVVFLTPSNTGDSYSWTTKYTRVS